MLVLWCLPKVADASAFVPSGGGFNTEHDYEQHTLQWSLSHMRAHLRVDPVVHL